MSRRKRDHPLLEYVPTFQPLAAAFRAEVAQEQRADWLAPRLKVCRVRRRERLEPAA